MRSLFFCLFVLVGSVAQAQCPPKFQRAFKANVKNVKQVKNVNNFNNQFQHQFFDQGLLQHLAVQQLVAGNTLYGPPQLGFHGDAYAVTPLDPNLSLRIAERAIKRSQELVEKSLRQLFEIQQAVGGQAGTETLPQPRIQVSGAAEVFANNCTSCHGSTAPTAGLDLTNLQALDDKKWAIFARVVDPDPTRHMPPGKWLSADEIAELAKFATGGSGPSGLGGLLKNLQGINVEGLLESLKTKGGNP